MSQPVFIDIEASGLHFDSYPIEIAVLFQGDIHSWLIKPEPNWTYWSEDSEKLHGITRDQLVKNGLAPKEVVKQLSAVLCDNNGLLYGDATNWDSDWFNTLYTCAGEPPPFYTDLLEEEQAKRFYEVKSQVANSGDYRQYRAHDDIN